MPGAARAAPAAAGVASAASASLPNVRRSIAVSSLHARDRGISGMNCSGVK
jgi:hypothetical protein